jgi:hypothetical protein
VKAAITVAAVAIATEGAGLDSVPVVVLACVVPFLAEIEQAGLTPGDELVVAVLRAMALCPAETITTGTGRFLRSYALSSLRSSSSTSSAACARQAL